MKNSTSTGFPYISRPHVTQREREILLLLCDGFSSKEIGSKLFISPHTVETHKRNLITKCAARNIVHLAVIAERYNLNNSIKTDQGIQE